MNKFWDKLLVFPRLILLGDVLTFLVVSLIVALTRISIVVGLLIGHPASATFTTLFKDAAHLWVGTLFGFWHDSNNHGDVDTPFYKFWFWTLCCLEILAAIATVTFKLVKGIPL